LGADRRVIVTHSPRFHQRQAQGFEQTLAKARRQLAELQARLARGRTRRPRTQVEAHIAQILKPRWLDRVVAWELTGSRRAASLRLHWRTDPAARRRLEAEVFGKRILFTDHDWPVADVVAAYRAQADVEAGFRQLKDPKVVSFSPMFHWTDQKIRVHALYCVLALMAAHLLRRRAAQAGIGMSVRELVTTLDSIQETVMVYPPRVGDPGRDACSPTCPPPPNGYTSCSALPPTPHPVRSYTTRPETCPLTRDNSLLPHVREETRAS
jgi:transposase